MSSKSSLTFFGFGMSCNPLQSSLNLWRNWWRHRQMGALWLESVFVGDVLKGNRSAVWGGVLERTLSFFGWFWTISIFQHTLFLSRNTVFGFVTTSKILIIITDYTFGNFYLHWYEPSKFTSCDCLRMAMGWPGWGWR